MLLTGVFLVELFYSGFPTSTQTSLILFKMFIKRHGKFIEYQAANNLRTVLVYWIIRIEKSFCVSRTIP